MINSRICLSEVHAEAKYIWHRAMKTSHLDFLISEVLFHIEASKFTNSGVHCWLFAVTIASDSCFFESVSRLTKLNYSAYEHAIRVSWVRTSKQSSVGVGITLV